MKNTICTFVWIWISANGEIPSSVSIDKRFFNLNCSKKKKYHAWIDKIVWLDYARFSALVWQIRYHQWRCYLLNKCNHLEFVSVVLFKLCREFNFTGLHSSYLQGSHSDWKNWEVGKSQGILKTRKFMEFMDKCYLLLFSDI